MVGWTLNLFEYSFLKFNLSCTFDQKFLLRWTKVPKESEEIYENLPKIIYLGKYFFLKGLQSIETFKKFTVAIFTLATVAYVDVLQKVKQFFYKRCYAAILL